MPFEVKYLFKIQCIEIKAFYVVDKSPPMHLENACQQPLGGSVVVPSKSLVSPSVVSVLIEAASEMSFHPDARLAILTGLRRKFKIPKNSF